MACGGGLDAAPSAEPPTAPEVDSNGKRLPPRGALLGIGAAVVALAAGAVAFLVIDDDEGSHSLTGSLTVVDIGSFRGYDEGDSCTTEGGYEDVQTGAQVVVRDGTGKTLATSELKSGAFNGLGCKFEFRVDDVPDADFYRIRIARETRGELEYSRRELNEMDWDVDLTLGD